MEHFTPPQMRPRPRAGSVKPAPSGVSIEAAGPGGCRVACHLRRWQRRVWFAGGGVGLGVPVVLRHAGQGAARRARTLAARLKKWGYRVSVKRGGARGAEPGGVGRAGG